MWQVGFYLASILVANWLVYQYGIIDLGFIMFPAGAVAIGITFSARDFVQKRWGKWACWIWMGTASFITVFFAPKLAFASVTAFLISEAVDWAVFTWTGFSLRKRKSFVHQEAVSCAGR